MNAARFSKAPAVGGCQFFGSWVPAFAGMTSVGAVAGELAIIAMRTSSDRLRACILVMTLAR